MSIGRTTSMGLATLCVAIGVAVAAPATNAAYTLSGSFGGAATTPADPEPLVRPDALAVSQATHDVYVVDTGDARIERFDASGNYLGQFNGGATPAGSFAFNGQRAGIAVDSSTSASDPSAGDVYILDVGHNVIDKFTATGAYVSQLSSASTFKGVAVDPSGNLWVTSSPGVEAREFDDAVNNVQISRWYTEVGEIEAAEGLAVDSSDDLFSEAGGCTCAGAKLTSEGVYEGGVSKFTSLAIAVDPVSNHVYLTRNQGSTVLEYDASAMTSEASKGVLLEEFGEGVVGSAAGISIDGVAGEVYVSDRNNGVVDIFSFPVLAGLAIGSPSNLNATSATLNATVDPIGRDAHAIEFEYGTTNSYGSTAPATPADAGSGVSPVPVSATLAGLIPNTLYHYRLRATNENGTSTTPDNTFLSPPAPARVNDQTPYASEVSQFAATLHGTVNPGNGVSGYRFVYGPTSAYGSSIPVPEGTLPLNDVDDAVSQRLGGLQAGTTYHYALVATNVGGTVVGPDQTFTTLPVPPPSVGTEAASDVTRGEALLSGTIDPHGWETSYRFEYGTTTAYGFSWPTIDVSLGAFTGAQPVSVAVSNLQPGTTYHYRLVATDGGGTSYGTDMSFTTAEYPASVIQPTPLVALVGFYDPEVAAKGSVHALVRAKHRATHKRHKRGKKRRKG
jgi:hypothetical protein